MVAYLLVVALVVAGFLYIQAEDRSDQRDSRAARLVVCKVINKRDMEQTLDLIAVADRQRKAAVASGEQPPPTPEEARRYQEGINQFVERARIRAINCTDFADNPTKYLTDPRVRSALHAESHRVDSL